MAHSGKVSEEVQRILQDIMQRYPTSEAIPEIEEFLLTAPILQQMHAIRKTIEENHKTEEYERYQRGELITPEALEGTPSQGTPEKGMTSYEGDSGGAGSSGDGRPRVKVLKVIKIEVEDDEEKDRSLGSILTAIVTVLMTVAMQWLFGRCQRRNQPLTEQQPTIEDEKAKKCSNLWMKQKSFKQEPQVRPKNKVKKQKNKKVNKKDRNTHHKKP